MTSGGVLDSTSSTASKRNEVMASLSCAWPGGKPGAADDIKAIQKSIRAAGKAGIPVMEYNFTPLRGSEGYRRTSGRGGSGLRDFDYDRVKDLPPLPNVGDHTREQMWERLEKFLKAVIPVAEEAGVPRILRRGRSNPTPLPNHQRPNRQRPPRQRTSRNPVRRRRPTARFRSRLSLKTP